jgi:hypothetical protein
MREARIPSEQERIEDVRKYVRKHFLPGKGVSISIETLVDYAGGEFLYKVIVDQHCGFFWIWEDSMLGTLIGTPTFVPPTFDDIALIGHCRSSSYFKTRQCQRYGLYQVCLLKEILPPIYVSLDVLILDAREDILLVNADQEYGMLQYGKWGIPLQPTKRNVMEYIAKRANRFLNQPVLGITEHDWAAFENGQPREQ